MKLFIATSVSFITVWNRNALTVTGGNGRGNTLNRLNYPKSLSIDKNDNIVIADSLNHRIMKYERNATTGRRIAGQNIDGYRPDMLYRPSNVIFDTELKSSIICDYNNRRMLQWALRSKKFTKAILENVKCFGLTMDDDGSLYVSDTERHEVIRYLQDKEYGTVVAGGNGQGRRLHQLNHPTYICIGKNQSVYISDSWNDRVVRWNKDAKVGVIVAGGNGKGKDRAQLNHPAGVLVDKVGTVYVADHWNGRVMRWRKGASKGEIIVGDRFLPGDESNELNGPESIAFDQDKNLYVSDSNNHRIQKFNIETT
jgi:hypothetical protein